MNLRVIYFILAICLSFPLAAQDYAGIFTDVNRLNLRGPVKMVRARFDRKMHEDKHWHNEIRRTHYPYALFDRNGLLIENLITPLDDSLIQPINRRLLTNWIRYDGDLKTKLAYRPGLVAPYPAINPYLINISYITHNDTLGWNGNTKTPPWLHTQVIYNYKFDNKNRLTEEVEYVPAEEFIVPKARKHENVFTRTSYFYNQSGYLSYQKIISNEDEPAGAILVYYSAHFMEFNHTSDLRRSFKYDEQGRLTNVSFTADGETAFSETYTYHPTDNYITELHRYSWSDATHKWYGADNIIEKFDRYGNITEAILKPEGDPEIRRYYEYTYDSYNNWTECRMYFGGDTSKPYNVAKRIIEYY